MKKVCLLLLAFSVLGGSAYAMKTHTIKTGDTLWALACKHYGDGSLYTILANYNNISNPRTILNGTVIKIPDKKELDDFKKGKKPSSNTPTNIKPRKDKESSKISEEDLSFENRVLQTLDSSKLQVSDTDFGEK